MQIESSKWVSARELSRHTSELLDHVSRGAHITVCRHGRPVAKLSPLLEAAIGYPTAMTEDGESEDGESVATLALTPEEERQLSELDPVQRRALQVMGEGGAPDVLVARLREHEPSVIAVALARLEMGRLIVKGIGGYRPTVRGARLVKYLGRSSG